MEMTGQQKKVYDYVRDSLMKSLDAKTKDNVLFAALIERIARTTTLLDTVEDGLFGVQPNRAKIYLQSTKPKDAPTYIQLLQEHRKYVEEMMVHLQ